MYMDLRGPSVEPSQEPPIREYPRTFDANHGLTEATGIHAASRSKMTYSMNNGVLAWVDGKNVLHLSINTRENEIALKKQGYQSSSWGVPGSNSEMPDFNEWKMREYQRHQRNLAEALPVPQIPITAKFWSSHTLLEPGQYAVSSDGKTIVWYCERLPDGQGGSGTYIITSPGSRENIAALEQAGYTIGVHDIALRADLDKWMQGLQK